MDYEQAINYLRSSGMSEEQIETVVNAIKTEQIETLVNAFAYSIIDTMADLLVELKEDIHVQH